jgi:hypothetical protein
MFREVLTCDMGTGTSRMYFTRVLYGMPLTTTPVMFWSSLGTTKCATTVAARNMVLARVRRYMVGGLELNSIS